MNKFLSIAFILISGWSFSLSAEKLIEKIQQAYDGDYHYSAKYSVFAGHKSSKAIDNYSGETFKVRNSIYQQIGESEFISTPLFSMQILSKEKIILLKNAGKVPAESFSFKDLKLNAEKLEIEESSDHFILTISYKKSISSDIALTRLVVNKTDFFVVEMTLFNHSKELFELENGTKIEEQLKLKVEFSQKLSKESSNEQFKLERYIKDTNNAATVSAAYNGYELYDLRAK